MNKSRKILSILVMFYFVTISTYVFYRAYSEVKQRQISNFNTYQLQIATTVAQNIQTYFDYFNKQLETLSSDPDVNSLNYQGKKKLEKFYKQYKKNITGITRLDQSGKIIYTVPYKQEVIGKDVSYQEQNIYVLKHHKPKIGTIIKLVQGYYAIVYAYPVFKNNKFNGSLSLLIPFRTIMKKYVSNIKIGKRGYAIVIDQSGIEIYSPHQKFIGKHINQNFKQYPSIVKAINKIINSTSNEGILKYSLSLKNYKGIRYASFKKVQLPGTNWFVIISVPEKQILAPLDKLRQEWFIYIVLFAIGLLLISYTIFKIWLMLKEERKRRQAEEELDKTRKVMEDVIENLPLALFILNKDSQVIYTNRKLHTIYGYSFDDFSSLEDVFNAFYPNEDKKLEEKFKITKLIKDISNTKSTGQNKVVTKIKCKDDRYKYVMLSVGTMGLNHIIILEDITTKYEKEELEQKLAEKENREQKMQAIGLMAGGVAHDLNNLLSGMVTYPEIILMELDKTNPLYDEINEILKAGKRAAQIVNDLVMIAKGIANHKKIINLNTIIKEFQEVELKNILANSKNLQVIFNLESNLLNMECSVSHIKKALLNLIVNAADAMLDEGTIIVETQNIYFKTPNKGYEIIPAGEYARLCVKDQGGGIDSKDIQRIFEPFYTKKYLNRKKSGTGLGLAIVWNTIKDHNGYIDIKTSEQGTDFYLYFPVSREIEDSKISEEQIQEYKGNGETILIVDDEERQRHIATQILNKMGYKPSSVSSGELAVKYVKNHKVDLILLDMMMEPGINGRETYEQILTINPNQKAIIVSGYAQNDEVVKARNLGVGCYIQKPYTVMDLCNGIKSTLNNENK